MEEDVHVSDGSCEFLVYLTSNNPKNVLVKLKKKKDRNKEEMI
jgi:hypothetical protein